MHGQHRQQQDMKIAVNVAVAVYAFGQEGMYLNKVVAVVSCGSD